MDWTSTKEVRYRNTPSAILVSYNQNGLIFSWAGLDIQIVAGVHNKCGPFISRDLFVPEGTIEEFKNDSYG